MRGKAESWALPEFQHRITPAYAGKSPSTATLSRGCRDHPRLCGEKNFISRMKRRLSGSPPPMRGKADRTRNKEGRNRITPAYAGKSSKKLDLSNCKWDHPRLCGEKRSVGTKSISNSGSPPPMRGKAHKEPVFFGDGRITPAYAGKRKILEIQNILMIGSPPPMRGKAGSSRFKLS